MDSSLSKIGIKFRRTKLLPMTFVILAILGCGIFFAAHQSADLRVDSGTCTSCHGHEQPTPGLAETAIDKDDDVEPTPAYAFWAFILLTLALLYKKPALGFELALKRHRRPLYLTLACLRF